jgi:hypothetical protein
MVLPLGEYMRVVFSVRCHGEPDDELEEGHPDAKDACE